VNASTAAAATTRATSNAASGRRRARRVPDRFGIGRATGGVSGSGLLTSRRAVVASSRTGVEARRARDSSSTNAVADCGLDAGSAPIARCSAATAAGGASAHASESGGGGSSALRRAISNGVRPS
jgi:hypothetical protein